ncbi:glycosyltransferase family 2 protein [Pseudooceanicola sp. CBS1P-1]|uniref:Glycosyltransferase family 2 protein n=1 Tax=Pseudooceanicola albus TaxID=2692189 RepID=A0A6L7FXX9_9RHOB|nr:MULTISPECIES: glycosyltransferase family 2 protein [Pseudooceanicola]MBT9383896.1 glycosyltransferase family 2 protein [Pseudooceanicola endophyticus]MXN16691.1 glycosyltransferase family 2 protein [Pseudooceanicola albus]
MRSPWRHLQRARVAFRQRRRRQLYLWRAFRARRDLRRVADRSAAIRPGDVLLFCVLRNESLRLPQFLAHYRALGVAHFLIVDNASTDGSAALLARQPDVSLWYSGASYRRARFGINWLNHLLGRYGHGHWCVIADADELLDYAGSDHRRLPALAARLEARGQMVMGAFLLDLFPKGRLGLRTYQAGRDPLEVLTQFDPGPFRARRQAPMGNLWLQGGTRDRVFFADQPARAPTLNKLPFLRWDRRYAFVNSSHSILPPGLNAFYSGPGGPFFNGVLLHTKFLPDVLDRAREDLCRSQHFNSPDLYRDYYEAILKAPDLSCPDTLRFAGTGGLVRIGLISSDEGL